MKGTTRMIVTSGASFLSHVEGKCSKSAMFGGVSLLAEMRSRREHPPTEDRGVINLMSCFLFYLRSVVLFFTGKICEGFHYMSVARFS